MLRITYCIFVLISSVVLLREPALGDDAAACSHSTDDEQVAACTRLINADMLKDTQLAMAYYQRGSALYRKGDFNGAIANFSEALRHDPKYVNAYSYRGEARRSNGDLDGAIADLDQAIRLDPTSANVYNTRASALRDKGDLDGAIAGYDQALRVNRRFAPSYTGRCRARYLKDDIDGAIIDCDQAIKIDPGLTAAYTDRGLAYEKKNDFVRARADYDAALAVPEKYSTGKWAHDTARERLATLPTVAPQVAPGSPPVGSIQSGLRVALVIGNSNYLTFPKILNPRNDAEDVAKELRDLGFEVLLGTDLKRADMEDMLIRFAKNAREADTALVFYAGHGLQHQGIDYLAPVDARVDDETDLRKLINLQDVIGDLQNAAHVRILIVDACRDNEVMQQVASKLPATRSAAFTRGLAAVSGADGTIIAFATQPNRVAADGLGRNSPFTQALLKNLPTPGLELRTLMTRVRAEVVAATGGAQRPEVWDSLVGEFAFKSAP